MGYKKVCFNCRKSFNDNTIFEQNCSECGRTMILINHKFRPPKKSDLKAWEVAEFLSRSGFQFQHIFKNTGKRSRIESEDYVAFPKTLDEAKIFIEQYKNQAIIQRTTN